MNVLASVYLALFTAIGGLSIYTAYREGERTLRWLIDVAVRLSLIYLFTSYWHRGLRDVMGGFAPVLYLSAIGWELFEIPADVRAMQADPELHLAEKIIAPLIGLGLSIPVYIFAARAVFSH